MLKYAAKRLGMGLVTLFVLATATFFLMKAIPGSPFGAEVSQMSAAAVEKLYEKYDLDKSIPEQYVIYIKNVLHNDFGESMTRKGISVNSIIAKALPITAKLGGVAFVFSMVTGIVLGIIAALSKRQWVQNSVMIFATVGVSVPSFLYALMLMTVFGVILQWLPFIGLKTPLHYILPAFSLSLYPISMVARLVRSSMTEAMKQDYMVLAKSKGTSPIKLIVKHALKNCLIPVVTYAGPLVAYLMTGSFVIESIFSIPGLGGEFVTSVTNRDYPLIMALTIFFGAFIIFTNLVSDLLTAMIDPRIKLEKEESRMNNLELKDMEWTEDLFEPLDSSEQNSEFIAMESKTFLQDSWNRFKKNKLALVGLVFLVLMILMAIFVPMFSKYSYDQMDMTALNQLPSAQHWFGTDKFGRDIFVRVMYGARISLAVGFSAAIICLFIGVVYGGISGYVGGKVDMVMMRIVDIIYAIPSLLYVIFIMLIFGSNVWSILMGICVSSWVGMARLVRSQVLSLKEQEFALAAYVLGASTSRILFKHLILNCIGAIIVNVTLMVPSAIFTEAFLSFVGIGISAPASSWGTLANEARGLIESNPIQIIWPVGAICLTMLSLNFIGDGVGEALDPKKK